MPPICAALLIPEIIKPMARLIPITMSKVFLSKIKRCCGSIGSRDRTVSAAPSPMTAPEAPAPTRGKSAGFAKPTRISS